MGVGLGKLGRGEGHLHGQVGVALVVGHHDLVNRCVARRVDREAGLLHGGDLDGEVRAEEMVADAGQFKDGEGGKVDAGSGVVGADVEGDGVSGGGLGGWGRGSVVAW